VIAGARAGDFTVHVNQQSNFTGLPCGADPSSTAACPTAVDAFKSIPLLPTLPNDTIFIYFSPGYHVVCNLSYVATVGSQITNRSLVLAPLNLSSSSNLVCSGNGNILSLDQVNNSYLIRDLSFVLNSSSMTGVDFSPVYENNSFSSYIILRCSFTNLVRYAGIGVTFSASSKYIGSAFFQISYSYFSFLFHALVIPYYRTKLPTVNIDNCVFEKNYFGVRPGSSDLIATNLNFSKTRGYSLDGDASTGRIRVINNTSISGGTVFINGGGFVYFNNVTISNIGGTSRIWGGGQVFFNDSIIMDSSTNSGMFATRYINWLTSSQDYFFKNVTFHNISSSTGYYLFAVDNLGNNPKNAFFESCSFYHRADQDALIQSGTNEFYLTNFKFINCNFFVISNSLSLPVLTRSLFQLNGQLYPSNSFSLIGCKFSNMTSNAPVAPFSFNTVWNITIVNSSLELLVVAWDVWLSKIQRTSCFLNALSVRLLPPFSSFRMRKRIS
jgi:hypothetical protein